MGSDLRLVLPLLRTLNLSPGLRLNYQVLCSSLAISVLELQETASQVNEIEPLLVQEGEDLVLTHKLDLLDPKEIQAQVNARGRFALKNVTTSTNAELMEELGQEEGLLSGDTLVAEIQTQGRSLRGTKWLTSIGTNIMLSLAFRFQNLQQLLGFSLAIGVATVTALEQLGVKELKLKWPNDVEGRGKKLAGILIETVPVPGSSEIFAIVGVGLNVHHSHTIDRLIDRPYTCLDDMGYNLTRNEVCINLVNEIRYTASHFKRSGLSPFIDTWIRHDALLGRIVEVEISSHRRVMGRVSGVNNLGELILESNSGRTALRSGHIVSVRS
ncbi:MAG: biotin--[acetyl-CoA-carboxylase] ligase [Anaerobiospirillum sp.]|nr:biotin--[acetyl-CoA-carboxylase] ligase [Anaerobiospirillum sp.]